MDVIKFTSANRSKRAKSSFSIFTKSWALYVEDMAVKPTISAYKILGKKNEILLIFESNFECD